jgi:hypothetical protein
MGTRDVAEGIAAIATLARWAGLHIVPTCDGIEILPPEEAPSGLCDCGHDAHAHGYAGPDVGSECGECSCCRFWPDGKDPCEENG